LRRRGHRALHQIDRVVFSFGRVDQRELDERARRSIRSGCERREGFSGLLDEPRSIERLAERGERVGLRGALGQVAGRGERLRRPVGFDQLAHRCGRYRRNGGCGQEQGREHA
jgi:hypothetical protein